MSRDGYVAIQKKDLNGEIKGGFLFFNNRLIPLRMELLGTEDVFFKDVALKSTNHLTVFLWGSPGASVAIEFKKLDSPLPPPEILFSAEPLSLIAGSISTLEWQTDNADIVTIDNGIGSVVPTGTMVVQPMESTTYTIAALGPGGSATASITIAVTPAPPAVEINAEPEIIHLGSTTTLFWSSSNTDSCVIEPDINDVEPNGFITVAPLETTTYYIVATGPGGMATASVTVDVTPAMPTAILTVEPATLMLGEVANLHWNTTESTACHIDPAIGSVDLNGALNVFPTHTTTYTLTATGEGGTATAAAMVTVLQPPTVQIDAEPATIPAGDNVMLTWSSTQADTAVITPDIGVVGISGSIIVSPFETTAYTIVAGGPGGSSEAEVTVNVVLPPPSVTLRATPNAIMAGDPATLVWSTAHAVSAEIEPEIGPVPVNGTLEVWPTEDTTYTITVLGPGGTTEQSDLVTVAYPLPAVTISAAPDTIMLGEATVLEWVSTGATDCTLAPDIGLVDLEGGMELYPSETTSYIVTATGPGGSATAGLTVTVTDPSMPPQTSFSAIPATIETGQSATLSWTSVNGENAHIDNNIGTVALIDSCIVTPENTTTYWLTVSGAGGSTSARVTIRVEGNPDPQPENSFGQRYEDLVPLDATIGAYAPQRFGLVTGLIKDTNGLPLSEVAVTILNAPEYGTAYTDGDGRFALPLQGGTTLTVMYDKLEYLTVHRKVYVGWNDVAVAETVTMISADPVATTIAFDGNPHTVFTHRSSPVTDEFGERSCTFVFTGDNQAYLVDADGNDAHTLSSIAVRATEYQTEMSMPAELPPTSGFTYCADLTADAVPSVRFEKPIVTWIENFLGFDTGVAVPVGFYDQGKGAWVPHDNGVVVRLLDTDNDGIVDALDADGDSLPDDLNQDGLVVDEVEGLSDSTVYTPDSTYWRSEIMHFSPWDWNFPIGGPDDSTTTTAEAKVSAGQKESENSACYYQRASFTDDRNRIHHENIPIPGTGVTLHYDSSRTHGYKHVLTVPVSGDSVPESLKRIEVKVTVAGQTLSQTLDPLPKQIAELVWDGRDFRGQTVHESVTAKVAIGFVYDGVYYVPSPLSQAFALAGVQVTDIPARQEVTLWERSDVTLRKGAGMIAEGWNLSPHHTMSLAELSFLFKGDGTVTANSATIIETVAGNGSDTFTGDGGAATDASISLARGVTVDAGGNVYIADSWNNRIRKIDTDGNITTVAGTGSGSFGGDGGQAVNAQIQWPYGITVDNTGNLYIADTYNNRIRRVGSDGIITTVAGSGVGGYSGDGGLATQAALDRPYGVVLDAEGNLFIADTWNNCIRKVAPNGIIARVAGTGSGGYNGREGIATQIHLYYPTDVVLDKDGNVYIADSGNGRIMKVDISGYMTTIAGNPWGSGGDGGLATDAPMWPYGVSVDREGNVYVTDSSFETYGGAPNNRIRKINAGGIITTVTGNGEYGYDGDGGTATTAVLARPTGLTLDAKGNLYFTDASNYRVRKVGPPSAFSAFNFSGDIFFAEPSGQGHILSSAGLHLATVDLNAGVDLYEFEYDDEKILTALTDQFGNQISIQRDAGGVPIAIISPEGLTTNLTMDVNGRMTEIVLADGSAYEFEYATNGLLTAKEEPNGNRFEHQYDANGRLILDLDQEGGTWQHTVIKHGTGEIQTEVLTAEGSLTTYLDHTDMNGLFTSTIVSPSGAQTLFTQSADGLSILKSLPCDMDLVFDYDVDPEYKFNFMRRMRENTPNALERVTQNNTVYADTDADEIPDQITRFVSVNGKETSLAQDVMQSQHTITSPEDRQVTIEYDPVTLLTTSVSVPGLLSTTYAYDAKGRPTSVTSGTRETAYAYNSDGFLETITDPLDNETTYAYDQVGRVTGVSRPDGSSLGFTYDDNGNMTILTNPSNIHHELGYNAVNRQNIYKTPLSGRYTYIYDRDRRLATINFPSGAQISNFFENNRLMQTQTPDGNIDYTYLCGTRIDSITKGIESLAFGYDGKLLTSEIVSGTLNTSLSYSYNDDFNLMSLDYAGNTENYTYDNDGLLTRAGGFVITRNIQNGLPETVSSGGFDLARTFNGYGEIESQSVTVNSQALSSWSLSQDDNGRITQRNEVVDGINANYVYTYDAMGRLETVIKDGALMEEYDYDENGTRIYEMNTARGISGRSFTYDDEDHLLSAGDTTYQYDEDGFLTTKIEGSEITTYYYSSRGELLRVTLPDNTMIEYIHDPLGRRIAKKVDGTIVEKYLWQGRTRLLAVYDGADNLIQRLIYAADRMPAAMTQQGQTYHFAYDQVGSLRIVADASGNVVKRIDYDAFGNILSDSNLSMSVPFGFAGGLQDRDISLVQFGYRDYDPNVGRWTAKDPALFKGGDTDLYGYALKNPANYIDPFGLEVLGPNMIKNAVPNNSLHYSNINIGGSLLFTDYSTQLHSSDGGLFPSTKTDFGISTTLVGGGAQFIFTASDLRGWDKLGNTSITFGIGRYLGVSLFPTTSQISLNIGLGVPPIISLSTLLDQVDHRCH